MDSATLTRRMRLLSEGLRIRMLHLLLEEEVSVSDLTRVLGCGQSTVSTHLARLAEEGLCASRREGRFLLYRATLREDALAVGVLARFADSTEAQADRAELERLLAERAEAAPSSPIGADYLPGRTWEAFARGLLAWLPREARLADVGVGRGDMALLFARQFERVIAIDRDEATLERLDVRADARGVGDRVETRPGLLENPPLEPGEVTHCIVSQVLHLVPDPAAALAGLGRALAPGTRLLLFDLDAHEQAEVAQRLGHRHLGFAPELLEELVTRAGFEQVDVRRASRDRRPPRFVTLQVSAIRATP